MNNNTIKENNNKYINKDNKIYRIINNENKVLLFELDNIKKWYVYDKDILLIKDDEAYLYNDETGLRIIVEYNELNYNNQELIHLWK